MNISDLRKQLSFFLPQGGAGNENFEISGNLISFNNEVYSADFESPSAIWITDSRGQKMSADDFVVRKAAGMEQFARVILEKIPEQCDFVNPNSVIRTGEKVVEIKGDASINEIEQLFKKNVLSTSIIYLLSDAGEGKTTLIHHLARKFAEDYLNHKCENAKILVPLDLGGGRTISNLDDMIAAITMNNYNFPIMPKYFFELARRGVLIPVLDGVEELFLSDIDKDTARATIANLVAALDDCGTAVISARRAFYELHGIFETEQIVDSIHKHDVVFDEVKLSKWDQNMFVRYAEKKGLTPEESNLIYSNLKNVLRNENADWFSRAFFVTKIVGIALDFKATSRDWMSELLLSLKNESAKDLTQKLALSIVKRETVKWMDKTSGIVVRPILKEEEHVELLSLIAEEMWSSKTEKLSKKVIEFIAEVFCVSKNKNPEIGNQVKNRLSEHAVLVKTNNTSFFAFEHETIFDYFLSQAILKRFHEGRVETILKDRDINYITIKLVVDAIKEQDAMLDKAIDMLCAISKTVSPISYVASNVGKLLIALLDGYTKRPLTLRGLQFPTDCLSDAHFANIDFVDCYFSTSPLDGMSMENCKFLNCTFEELCFEKYPTIKLSSIDEKCKILLTEMFPNGNRKDYRDPTAINYFLSKMGFEIILSVTDKQLLDKFKPTAVEDDDELIVIQKVVNLFSKATTISVNTIQNVLGSHLYHKFEKILTQLINSRTLKIDQKRPFHYKLGSKSELINNLIANSNGNNDTFFRLMKEKAPAII